MKTVRWENLDRKISLGTLGTGACGLSVQLTVTAQVPGQYIHMHSTS